MQVTVAAVTWRRRKAVMSRTAIEVSARMSRGRRAMRSEPVIN
jgi:hypothetical protein